jgi:MFS family permease
VRMLPANFYLYTARAARGFGDGFAAIILPAYLSALGFSSFQIGLVATAALLGSAVVTLAIGLVASCYGLRTLLLAFATLMVATGIGLGTFQHFAFVMLIAMIGTVNPTIGDIGVHVPLEQAFLADGCSDDQRTSILARYSFIGALAISAGALAAGAPDSFVFEGTCLNRCARRQTAFNWLFSASEVFAGVAVCNWPLPYAVLTNRLPSFVFVIVVVQPVVQVITAESPSSFHVPFIPSPRVAFATPPLDSVISNGCPAVSFTFHTPSKALAASAAKPIMPKRQAAITAAVAALLIFVAPCRFRPIAKPCMEPTGSARRRGGRSLAKYTALDEISRAFPPSRVLAWPYARHVVDTRTTRPTPHA